MTGEQLSLLDDVPRARRSDPATSQAAAERTVEFRRGHQMAILAALIERGPGSVYDIAEWTGMTAHAVGKRMDELKRQGEARPTGEVKASPSGRLCRIWRACA